MTEEASRTEPEFTVISLGAGVQSSTMALMAAKGLFPAEWNIKAAIFADTQAEPQAVYRWLDWLETQLPFPVLRVTHGSLAEDSLVLRRSLKTGKLYHKTYVPFFIKHTDGKTGVSIRKCTEDYKIVPIYRGIKELIGKQRLNTWRRKNRNKESVDPIVRVLIGISYDEYRRMKPARERFMVNHWPLVDRKITRKDCLAWMESNNYPMPPRSACVFCPYKGNQEWQDLKDNAPADFLRAARWDRNIRLVADCDSEERRANGELFVHPSCKPLSQIDFGDTHTHTHTQAS